MRYHLEGRSTATSVSAGPEAAGGKAVWEDTAAKREASLRERKAQMILAARECASMLPTRTRPFVFADGDLASAPVQTAACAAGQGEGGRGCVGVLRVRVLGVGSCVCDLTLEFVVPLRLYVATTRRFTLLAPVLVPSVLHVYVAPLNPRSDRVCKKLRRWANVGPGSDANVVSFASERFPALWNSLLLGGAFRHALHPQQTAGRTRDGHGRLAASGLRCGRKRCALLGAPRCLPRRISDAGGAGELIDSAKSSLRELCSCFRSFLVLEPDGDCGQLRINALADALGGSRVRGNIAISRLDET